VRFLAECQSHHRTAIGQGSSLPSSSSTMRTRLKSVDCWCILKAASPSCSFMLSILRFAIGFLSRTLRSAVRPGVKPGPQQEVQPRRLVIDGLGWPYLGALPDTPAEITQISTSSVFGDCCASIRQALPRVRVELLIYLSFL
jgi:hypothetical protein